jgi:predicted DNA binding protein
MSITVKIYVEHEHLALVPTLRSLGGVSIRVVAHGNTDPGSTVFPFVIEYDDRDALEAALDADSTVAEYEAVDWTDGVGIYFIEHTPGTKLISRVVTEVSGFTIYAEMKNSGWVVRLLLPDRTGLNAIWEYAAENDITLEILEVYGRGTAGTEGSYGLTEEQRDALTTAYEAGYFNEPRDTSLSEVAAEMGLSSTAMSGRLRRGMRNLIAATISDDETGEE